MHTTSVLFPLGVDQAFFYKSEKFLQIGTFVRAPFRGAEKIGVVWKAQKHEADELKKAQRVYEISDILEEIEPLGETLMQFLEYLAKYNVAKLGNVLKMCIHSRIQGMKNNQKMDWNEEKVIARELLSVNIKLSNEQSDALAQILECCKTNETILLHGVTGSGKTNVYLHAIANQIKKRGDQALILLPEITLATQIMEKISSMVENSTIKPWHSSVSPANKRKTWHQVQTGSIDIIIGARSALFLPFKNLKIIIVDEEHDTSFKQNEQLSYHARDMSILRSKLEEAPIILASATPSLESYHNTKIGRYKKVTLPNRFGAGHLAKISAVDMHTESMRGYKWLSITLHEQIKENLIKQKQTLLFLNRKGHSLITFCGICQTKIKCPICQFWLVFHRSKSILLCHHCGHNETKKERCDTCGGNLISYGFGLERVEEDVRKLFPKARLAMLTSDTINSKKVQTVLNSITNHEIDIIIGTQVISKGLNFDLLQLVGVLDSDFYYTTGDIRSMERMYQLLHQVAGRAGRKTAGGIALIQSYEPQNPLLKHLTDATYQDFLESELTNRKAANMPPFGKLALIKISAYNEKAAVEYAQKLKQHAPKDKVLGPMPAPISMLRAKYRYRLIVYTAKDVNIQRIIRELLKKVKAHHKIDVQVDIDPYNFL